MEALHWTFGVCSKEEQTCQEQRYDVRNITQITGIKLAKMNPGSIELALFESMILPKVESMNCEELCNCVSCGHGHCSDQEDQGKCPGNENGFICRCSNSPSYPILRSILLDMLSTGRACRQC